MTSCPQQFNAIYRHLNIVNLVRRIRAFCKMERPELIGFDHVDAQRVNQPNFLQPSFWSTCISLKVLKPTAWGEDDHQVYQHDTNLELGLHIPKRYLVIAQKVEGDDTEVYLRFAISLSDISYNFISEHGTSKLCISVHSLIRHEVIHSDHVNTATERQVERGLVQLSCTLPARAFEMGTTLVIRPKNTSHQHDFHHLVQMMERMFDGDSNIPKVNIQREITRNWYPPRDHPPPNGALSVKSRIRTRQTPHTSPAAPGALAGDEFSDKWQGLEQLDLQNDLNPRAVDDAAEKIPSATSNASIDIEHLIPVVTASTNIVATYSTSGENSRPLTPADDIPEINTVSSGTGYLASTANISTIQSLPSAIFPPSDLNKLSSSPPTRIYTHSSLPARKNASIVPVLPTGEHTPSGRLQDCLAEQERQQHWDSRSTQWSLFRTREKCADAKLKYVSGPRTTDDSRIHDLRVDRAGELRRGALSNASERGGNESTQVQATVMPATVGTGRGVFGLASGKLIPRTTTSNPDGRYPAAGAERHQQETRRRGQPRSRHGDFRGRGRRGAWNIDATRDRW